MNYYEKFKYSLSSYDNEIILNNFKTLVNKKIALSDDFLFFWQEQKGSNPQPSVLETDALPIELCSYTL